MEIIARIYTDFKEKFGIPRQSGLVPTVGRIVFEPKYRHPDALRGIEGYSHLWLIWSFHLAKRDEWSPTVRPPRLGGNAKMGVFATRSPFRPNPIGLSSVELIKVERTQNEGDVIYVKGADILDGTPIYDIKPYLPYTDSHPDARSGFAGEVMGYALEVEIGEEHKAMLDAQELDALTELLSQDPRPSYKADGDRVYGFLFGEKEIFFKVEDGRLTVTDIKVK